MRRPSAEPWLWAAGILLVLAMALSGVVGWNAAHRARTAGGPDGVADGPESAP